MTSFSLLNYEFDLFIIIRLLWLILVMIYDLGVGFAGIANEKELPSVFQSLNQAFIGFMLNL